MQQIDIDYLSLPSQVPTDNSFLPPINGGGNLSEGERNRANALSVAEKNYQSALEVARTNNQYQSVAQGAGLYNTATGKMAVRQPLSSFYNK